MTADLLTDQELADLRKVMEEGVFAYYPRFLPLLDHIKALRADRDTLLDALTRIADPSNEIVQRPDGAHTPKAGWQAPYEIARDALARVRSHTGKDPA